MLRRLRKLWAGSIVLMAVGGCGEERAELDAVSDALQSSMLRPIRTHVIRGIREGWEDSVVSDSGQAAEYDAQGNLILAFQYYNTGSIDGIALPSEVGESAWLQGVAKINPQGQVVWVKPVPYRRGPYDWMALTVDPQGAVLLSYRDGLMKLRADGSTAWSRSTQPEPGSTFSLPAFASIPGSSDFIAVSALENLYPGNSYPAQLMVIRYRGADSTPLWTQILNQQDNAEGRIIPQDVAVDEFGQIYIVASVNGKVKLGNVEIGTERGTGAAALLSLTPTGTVRWAKKLADEPESYLSVATREGHLAVGLFGQDTAHPLGAYLISFDLSGNERWRKQLNGPADTTYLYSPFDVELGPKKEIVVALPQPGNLLGAPTQGDEPKLLLAKFDRVTGVQLALRSIQGTPLRVNGSVFSNGGLYGDLAIQPVTGNVTFTGAFMDSLDIGGSAAIAGDGQGSTGFAATFTP
jgi:hypothetical protein